MSERTVKCPNCPQFGDLIDAGDFHAYVCPACGWSRPTTDRRPGNRPADVCALCDTAMDLAREPYDLHNYIGFGWISGAGGPSDSIAVHVSCLDAWRDFRDRGMGDGCTCHPGFVKFQERHRPWCMEAEPVVEKPTFKLVTL